MLAFISTPYSAVLNAPEFTSRFDKMADIEAHETALHLARRAAEIAKTRGFLPISPVLNFDGVYSESAEREAVCAACSELIQRCDVFFYAQTPYTAQSKGMRYELELARSLSKKIIEVDCD